jgi:two-component system alkaline phosphatase synthesis response regulator PhoP
MSGVGRLAVIVDDVGPVREAVAGFLTQLGFESIGTDDVETVMEVALTRRPAVIVVDLVMPWVDGATIITQLRRSPGTSGIPIVVMSGRAEELNEAEKFFGRDRVTYLHKPFTRDQLERAVQEVAGGRS